MCESRRPPNNPLQGTRHKRRVAARERWARDQQQDLTSILNERCRNSDTGDPFAGADVFGLQQAYRHSDWIDEHGGFPGGDAS
jgi:hypothetical protein